MSHGWETYQPNRHAALSAIVEQQPALLNKPTMTPPSHLRFYSDGLTLNRIHNLIDLIYSRNNVLFGSKIPLM
jgi:hypothetical protein